jgi:glutathione S-transferase
MISDSAVICEFLDELFQPPALMPAEPLQRAEVRMWVRFADMRLYSNTQQLLYAAPAAERPRYALALQEDLRHMDEYLSRQKGPYWLGERFSHVDATFLPWFEQCIAIEKFRGFAWPENLSALSRWHARVAARPSVRAVSRSPEFYERACGALMTAAFPKAVSN